MRHAAVVAFVLCMPFGLSGCFTPEEAETSNDVDLQAEGVEPVDMPAAAYKAVEGWPGYLCADMPDGKNSQWKPIEQPGEKSNEPQPEVVIEVWNGTCVSWQQAAAATEGELTDDPTEPPADEPVSEGDQP